MNKSIIISTFLCIGLLFSSAATLHAQTFGLKAGANLANYNDISGNLDARAGLLIGGFLKFDLPVISIQPEVLYSQKGAEDQDATIKVDYLEIPVIAKLNFIPAGPVKLNLQAGPYVGIVLNSEASGGGFSVDIDNAQTDFGGTAGAGAEIGLGVSTLTIDARYGFGFNDAFDGGQGKNGVISLAAGITF